jgi:hypothetical protein
MGIKGRSKAKDKRRNPKHWIFCEGDSETAYFEEIKNDPSNEIYRRSLIKALPSGGNTQAVKLLNFALAKKKSLENEKQIQRQDTFWLVFDRDENSSLELQQIVRESKNEGFLILYSNPCFEFWYRLHFSFTARCYQVSQDCKNEIKSYLPDYKEGKSYYKQLYNQLPEARQHALQLSQTHQVNSIELISRDSEPISTIYEFFDFLDNQVTYN